MPADGPFEPMNSKPSRLQTILLMLPTWGFAHAVLIFRVLPLDPKGGALVPDQMLPFVFLFGLAGILHQVVQQAIFGRAQFYQFIINPHLTAPKINFQAIINLEHLAARRWICSLSAA